MNAEVKERLSNAIWEMCKAHEEATETEQRYIENAICLIEKLLNWNDEATEAELYFDRSN